MNCETFDRTFAQPEEHTGVRAEALEIRMTGGALPAVVVDRMGDAES